MTRAPQTFLLTDVARSTALWEEDAPATAAALVRHDALLADAVAGAGGRVVWERGEGDSRMAVFDSAVAATAAAAGLARAVAAEAWPTPRPFELRMAVHTVEGELGGAELARVTRLRAAAWPSQVLLSAAAATALANAGVRELGRHALGPGLAPEPVFQLVAPGLRTSFPPPPNAHRRHNLPPPTTSFVGREVEVAEVSKVLASHRLVTVVGVGGAGKTRLGTEVARTVAEDYADGVWLVELAALEDAALVPQAVAAALGVREQGGRDLSATLAEWLGPRELVMVLDNCEHLLGAASALASRLLRAAAGLRVLATSREPLGVAGELCWPIPPLETPDPTRLRGPEALAEFEATALFWERAAAARPGLALDEANAGAAARICAGLDGLPLAIELAAAGAATLSLLELDRRLDDRLRLLASGAGHDRSPARQRTLRAAIDWSHDLLVPPEQVLFRRLAAFAGSFALEAAEAVCPDDLLPPADVVDLLVALVAKSLVAAEDRGAATRYRMLETVRAYAAERLAEAGEGDEVGRRHLAWALQFADDTHPRLCSPEVSQTLDRLDDDHDNFRRALRWALDSGRGEDALRLSVELRPFWAIRGHWREGRAWTEEALQLGSGGPPARRAHALIALGELMLRMGDRPGARRPLEEAVAIFEQLGDLVGVAEAWTSLAESGHGSDQDAARRLDERALAAWRAAGTTRGHWGSIATVFHNLAQLAWSSGDRPAARRWFALAAEESRRHGDVVHLAYSLAQTMIVEDHDGNYEQARALGREALRIVTAVGDPMWTGVVLRNLAMIAVHEGKPAEAAAWTAKGLAVVVEAGATTTVTNFVEVLGWAAGGAGAYADAARTLGASERRREHYSGSTRIGLPAIQAEHDAVVAGLRAALGDGALAQAWAEGRSKSLDDAIEDATVLAHRLSVAVPRPGSGRPSRVRPRPRTPPPPTNCAPASEVLPDRSSGPRPG